MRRGRPYESARTCFSELCRPHTKNDTTFFKKGETASCKEAEIQTASERDRKDSAKSGDCISHNIVANKPRIKKGRDIPAPAFLNASKTGASGGFLLLGNVLLRSAVLALGSDIAINQFDHGHIGIVAITHTSF